ncbi:O-antigen ligase family protein [Longitalea arenae]|uniref:O-antigen ligase family protein n=1 Tax=Longitalea arenae TaxID=2812558 RepID=UPI001968374F|nr:O-antigen ligase family protein [Longitalea arenae]
MRSLFLMDNAAGLLTIKDKILYILVVIFLLTFYPGHMPAVNNVALGLLSVYCFFFYSTFREKYYLLRKRKEVVAMTLFYLLHIVSAYFSKDQAEGFSWVVVRMPLFVFPVSLGLVYIKQALKERIIWVFSVITAFTLLICTVWSVYHTISRQDLTLLYNDNLTILTDKQSIYIALLVNLAVFGFGYLLAIRSKLITNKWLVYGCLFILLVANFLLASRIAIITLYGSIICTAIWYAVQQKKFKLLAMVVAGVAVTGILLVSIFPKTLNRFRELKYTNYEYTHKGVESHFDMVITPDQWNGANIRLAVWSCGWELVKQHPWLGVQLGDKLHRLVDVYAAKHFDFAYESRRNMHNNYLDILVTFGITGFLLFLWGFLIEPLRHCIHRKDFFGILVIAAFMLSFIPENYFDRSMGNMMFAFFIAFIVSYREPPADPAHLYK